MSEPPARGVVVGHGEMASGLVSAVRRIAGGAADALEALSNDGKAPEVLKGEIERLAGDDRVVVFVDLQAGSCGVAAYACCRERSQRAVICGVNLPMLLDFVFHRELPLDELADRLIQKSRASIGQPLTR